MLNPCPLPVQRELRGVWVGECGRIGANTEIPKAENTYILYFYIKIVIFLHLCLSIFDAIFIFLQVWLYWSQHRNPKAENKYLYFRLYPNCRISTFESFSFVAIYIFGRCGQHINPKSREYLHFHICSCFCIHIIITLFIYFWHMWLYWSQQRNPKSREYLYFHIYLYFYIIFSSYHYIFFCIIISFYIFGRFKIGKYPNYHSLIFWPV